MSKVIRRKESGVVALEFVLLFPFILALLYAAAVYGVLFLNQYRIQNAVERAVQVGLYTDRSTCGNDGAGSCSPSALAGAVRGRAESALGSLAQTLPLKHFTKSESSCKTGSEGGVEMVHCRLSYTGIESALPVFSFGMLGSFPPLPKQLTADARAAF